MPTSPHYSVPEQARIHAFFATGFKAFKSFHLVKAIHGLAHISLLFFLIGLSLYCDTFNVIASDLVAHWFVVIYFVYALLTVIPVLWPGIPFSTPLTPIFALAYTCVVRGVSRLFYLVKLLVCFCMCGKTRGVGHPKGYHRGWTSKKVVEDNAKRLAERFDEEIFKRTLHILRSDDDLERFFDAIPGFCDSKVAHDPRKRFDKQFQQRLAEVLVGFWNRTLSSNLISEDVKGRRLLVCLGAIDATDLATAAPGTIRDLSFRYFGGITRSVELGHSLGNLRHGNVAPLARGIIASIISNAERNDRWYTLAMDELGISRDVLQAYLAHGDSVLLANLIHITRLFIHHLQPHFDLTREALGILASVSKFDILNTLPVLQHDFCALWNVLVRQVHSMHWSTEDSPFKQILFDIWGLYVALHRTAGHFDPLHPPSSYPFCVDDRHRISTTHERYQ